MRKLNLIAGAMLMAAPLFAADSGWFVGLGGALGTQTGNDVVLANTTDANTNPNGIVKLQMDSKPVFPLLFGGYHADFGTVTLSGWYNKSTGTTTAYDPKGYLLLSFGSPWNDNYRANGLWARQESKSHAIDLTFSRDIVKTDKSQFEWMLGLREWKLENTLQANACRDDASGFTCLAQSGTANPYTYRQNVVRENSDSHGIGITIGVKAHYKFNDRFSAASWARFGMLRGSSNLTTQDEGYYGPGASSRCDNNNSYCSDSSYGTKRTFQQTDIGAKLIVNFVAGFDGFVGYTFSSFQDGASSLDYTINGGYGYGPAIRTRNVGYDGVLLGLSYRF